MAQKAETPLQARLQSLIEKRGGYVKKNHGNMITEKGLADLSFTYKGVSFYWEVKTPEDKDNVSPAQGIHCRKARKAGGITAIVWTTRQADTILDHMDYCFEQDYSIRTIWLEMDKLYKLRGLNDGTSY